jgi:hypothetical protein
VTTIRRIACLSALGSTLVIGHGTARADWPYGPHPSCGGGYSVPGYGIPGYGGPGCGIPGYGGRINSIRNR